MPLDPHLEGLLGLLDLVGPPELSAGSPEEARALLRAVTVNIRLLDASLPVGRVTDHRLRLDGRRLRVRVYRPPGRRPVTRPTLVFFHGGGFVIGDLDTHDVQCRWLCRELDAVVVSVDHRLAPEHPFPAAVEDALTATRWATDGLRHLGGDPERVAVAGDSAGGNLAAVVAQEWRSEVERGRQPLKAQLLLYPVVDLEDESGTRYPSRLDHADGYILTGDDMRWFALHYVGESADRRDPRISPINGDLRGLPPAVVATAEFDPLRDEGDAYAAALRSAGVRTVHHRFDGLIHGFFGMAALSPACARAVLATCASLRAMLDG